MDLAVTLLQSAVSFGADIAPAITPKSIPGVDDIILKVLGWVLWLVSVASLIGLLIVVSAGFEAYRHNQGENIMEKAKLWIFAAIIGSTAKDIVNMFIPGFTMKVVAIAIPGMEGPVVEILGNLVWLLQIAAFACILFLAVKGFIAFNNNGAEEFVSKFFWFIVASLGVSLATTIAGAFFPAALKFG